MVEDHSRGADPIDQLLAAYSAGGLDPALSALVASHLLLSPRNRAFVRRLDGLAGAELEAIAPVALSNRDAMLAAIFASGEARGSMGSVARSVVPAARPGDIVLPAPLRDFIGAEVKELRFKTLIPGVREHVVARSGRGDSKLMWVKAGRRMPRHTHEGAEITLVLSGAFTDSTGRYGAGDIAIAESDLDHQPLSDPDSDCLCFAVTDAPLHLTGPIGRIVDRLFSAR